MSVSQLGGPRLTVADAGTCLASQATESFSAASVNYGSVPSDAEVLLATACPIVGSYGAKDKSLRGAAARLERILTAAGVPHDVKEYADAGHSFLNDHDPSSIPLVFKLMDCVD